MDKQKDWLEFTRDSKGGWGLKGVGEEGVILAALVGAVIVVFVGGGLFLGLRDWPLALIGVAAIAGMTYLTKLKFEHVQVRKLKALDLAPSGALAQERRGS